MTRAVTNKILGLIDEGALDPNAVVLAALSYMSEDDVADMARVNELFPDDEERDEDEEVLELRLPPIETIIGC